MSGKSPTMASISFTTLATWYKQIQSSLVQQIKSLVQQGTTHATPGQFLLIQFSMSQVTQIGDSISNLIAQVNTMINKAVQNQRTQ